MAKTVAHNLGIHQRTFEGYICERREDNLWPILPAVLSEYPMLNREWLYFGEGPMLKTDSYPKKGEFMTGKVEDSIKALATVRGEIAVTKMRLAQAEETERELLRQILGLVTDESDDMESLWSRQADGDFEAALVIDQDVAVVKIEEDYFERPALSRHEAVNVSFVPMVQQAL